MLGRRVWSFILLRPPVLRAALYFVGLYIMLGILLGIRTMFRLLSNYGACIFCVRRGVARGGCGVSIVVRIVGRGNLRVIHVIFYLRKLLFCKTRCRFVGQS